MTIGNPGVHGGRSGLIASPRAWLLDERRGQHWRLYGAGLAIFYLLFSLACQLRWFLNGSMWAEMATNYFANARTDDVAMRLLATDAGYYPLPPRLLALLVHLLGVPAAAVPYVYQLTAFVAGGLMVATFSHRVFRPLVADDRVRALLCLVFALLVDFELRGFVNFSYLGLLVTVPLVALALQRDGPDAPWWAWWLPLLMLSKPVEVALLPLMALGVLFAKPRFRRVLAVGMIAGAIQLARLAFSQAGYPDVNGQPVLVPDYADPTLSLVSRLATAVLTGSGLLSGYTLGPPAKIVLGNITPWLLIVTGVALAGFYLLLLWRLRRTAPMLVLTGGTVLYAAALMNSFALSRVWNLDFYPLIQPSISRSTIGCIAGALFALMGALQVVARSHRWRAGRLGRLTLLPVMVAWFCLSLWPVAAYKSLVMPFPMSGSSHWLAMADRIDRGGPVCVPVDPYVADKPLWMFRRGCVQLDRAPAPTSPARPLAGAERVPLPAANGAVPLLGLMVAGYPAAAGAVEVQATAIDAEGRPVTFVGRQQVNTDGGSVLMLPTGSTPPVVRSPLVVTATSGFRILADDRGRPAIVRLALAPPRDAPARLSAVR